MSATAAVPDEFLTIAEVAELLKVPANTVRYWRHTGTGPAAVSVGRHIRYRRRTVEEWAAGRESLTYQRPA